MKPNLLSEHPQLWVNSTFEHDFLIISYPDGQLEIESEVRPSGWWLTQRETAFAWRNDAFKAGFVYLGDIK
jgi:hypothetical protein